ncbi:polyketide synthase [Apiospora arundinis]
MAKSNQTIPSILVFGPQTRPSPNDLADLRHELRSNSRLSRVHAGALDLPIVWRKLVALDSDLSQVAADSHLQEFLEWLEGERETPYCARKCSITLTFLLNYLIQIKQYVRFLHSVDRSENRDAQSSMLERLRLGGVHGFCVGFLCATVVSLSGSEDELADNAVRALRLAFAIGVYVERDTTNEPTTCISARWRHKQANAMENARIVLNSYPEAYIAGITDETSMTITIPNSHLAGLVPGLEGHEFSVREIPVDGRFHSPAYTSVVERLVSFFTQSPDLRFPSPDQLQVPIRSGTDGKPIQQGDLIRHSLENTLLKPVNWYKTLTLAMDDIPQKQKCIALAGLSNHFPLSLVSNPNTQLQLLRGLGSHAADIYDNTSIITGAELTPSSTKEGNDTEGSWVFASDEDVSGDDSSTHGLPSDFPPHSVAVVGMAGRFPGANSVDEFWDLLSTGTSAVQEAPGRIGLEHLAGDYSYKKWWGNFIDEPDTFDHKLFKKSPREALACDPQQRKLLEVVYEALESSGYFGTQTCQPLDSNDYGCYIGATQNNYANNVSTQAPSAYATIGTGRSFISGAVSHYFGFTGPALTVDTACSSSLVAIHTACQAILAGDCSSAIAGGTNIITSPHDYRDLQAAGFLSPTGQCKPFDAGADGYCRGEAVAVVVLKSLKSALRDHDRILGVIMGSAVNQNANEAHITVPHSGSQTKLYRKAMNMAKVAPGDVTFVEAHGTGTTVGDPIEVRSLRDAFGGASQRESMLYFSSLKGNMGHAESAAGVAGLIKVLLMLKHGQIPPQASYQSLNPAIPALEPDCMAIPKRITPWKASKLVACVNSYGAAGSNSAVMVCGPPAQNASVSLRVDRARQPAQLPFIICAATKSSLSQYCQKLLDWLEQDRLPKPLDNSLVNVLFDLANRANRSLEHKLVASVSDMNDLKLKLLTGTQEDASAFNTLPSPKPVVLVFAGQESQSVGLSEELYTSCDIFRRHLDNCQELLLDVGLEGIYPAIFQKTAVENIVILHAALFSVQYASAKAWIDCGLHVNAVVGHSFGLLTALCVSGVLSLSDSIRLVTGRALLIQKHWGSEPGSMVSIQADRQDVMNVLDRVKHQIEYAEIACFNGPKSHVVVGSSKSIDAIEGFLTDEGHRNAIRAKRLAVNHGFHSIFTEPLLPHLEDLASELDWKHPTIHLELCEEVPTDTQLSHRYIAQHMRRPVYFKQAVKRLVEKYPDCVWLEAGRGSSITQLVRVCLERPERHSLHTPTLRASAALESLVDVTVKLWKEGQKFQKTRHWLPYVVPKMPDSTAPVDRPVEPLRHELLSLVNGNKIAESIFRISPKSDRFKTLVAGHVMADRAAMPASLYIEVASRAALLLQEDLAAATWVPTVKDLVMKSPVGLNPEAEITLTMKSLDGPSPSWEFSIMLGDIGSARAQETTTGVVYLKARSDPQVAKNLRRYESLINPARWDGILNHPDAETMRGKHIYRAFSQIVQYSDLFKGIKTVSCLGGEAVAEVCISSNAIVAADQRLTDTPMIDSFLQIAGFMSNYFNDTSSPGSLFLCHHIEHLEFGPMLSPDAGHWVVFASMTDNTEDHTSVDVYVFDKNSKRLVLTALGMDFSKISCSVLTRILDGAGVDKPNVAATPDVYVATQRSENDGATLQKSDISTTDQALGSSGSKRAEVFRIIANIADVDVEEIAGEITLPDVGIDSLGVTEMISDVSSMLHVDLDLATMLALSDINALVAHIDSQVGLHDVRSRGSAADAGDDNKDLVKLTEQGNESPKFPRTLVRLSYDDLGAGAGAIDYWRDVYLDDVRLMIAYIIEAFAKLGCNLRAVRPGEDVPDIDRALPRHRQLIHQLHLFLADEGVISASSEATSGFKRLDSTLEVITGEQVHQEIISKHPLNATVRHLIRAVGSQLAECLTGQSDGLQIVFGNKKNKKTLEDLYQNWPMLVAATKLLGNFLRHVFSVDPGERGAFRILEVGAGTGGTTRYIVDFLRKHNIRFDYHFTDLSGSLVQKVKRSFKDVTGEGNSMTFGVLDIEQEPPAEFLGAFHVVISTNCIHATRNLTHSLTNVRKMVRPDGAVTLIEMTKTMYIFDIIVGLLEGWWLFEDGRSHALADEARWTHAMHEAGFQEVLFSNGKSTEAKTVRVIGGFLQGPVLPRVNHDKISQGKGSSGFTIQGVVYKTVSQLKIHADIYCPEDADPVKKMPIALMIHGGSHILFSRKDIRPPQIRIMLDMGLLPVSLDHRLCPEVTLAEGPMVDVCDALAWARKQLPKLRLVNPNIRPDSDRVVVVGWSSGGQLAMSAGWTAPQRGLKPPNAVLAFYSPTDYEDEWWQSSIQPVGAEDWGEVYDVLEAVKDKPTVDYQLWCRRRLGPLSDPRIRTDPRCRIVLHVNWRAQMLPVIIGGLISRYQADQADQSARAAGEHPGSKDWSNLPQPSIEKIRQCSPLAQIRNGSYATPTFMIHGTADDLIPYAQSVRTTEEMKRQGIDARLVVVPDAPHVCDASNDPDSAGWKAVLKAYEWLGSYI